MPKCVYCGGMYDFPRGLTLVMKDGTINHLCSSKCKKNMFMKRRKVRWISKNKKDKSEKAEKAPEKAEEKPERISEKKQ